MALVPWKGWFALVGVEAPAAWITLVPCPEPETEVTRRVPWNDWFAEVVPAAGTRLVPSVGWLRTGCATSTRLVPCSCGGRVKSPPATFRVPKELPDLGRRPSVGYCE